MAEHTAQAQLSYTNEAMTKVGRIVRKWERNEQMLTGEALRKDAGTLEQTADEMRDLATQIEKEEQI
ncbi:hypothetical protein [Halodesulfovibrio aestuarii]|uniref:t-SNARE coiled-coil homology domain-containing protein n=1 Tax=Halodesulfovibrio aestuarii TaxID=126333 RepID=A0ABV4JUL9_9BACT